MALARIRLVIAEVVLIASGFTFKSANYREQSDERRSSAQSTVGSGETEAALQEVFCWAIAGPWDKTTALLVQQIKGCGSYAIFSNYSDDSANVTKLFADDMKVTYSLAGWAMLSPMVQRVWAYIGDSSWPEQFKWFVKLEPDTFFRPRFLPQILARYDSEEPMGFAPGGHLRFQGSIEIVSHKVFRDQKSAQFLQPGDHQNADDIWFTRRFRKVDFKLVSGMEGVECEAFCRSCNYCVLG